MDTYFERLEEIIKRHEQEIDHLNAERMALRREENNMSFDAFNREYQRIINYLENESRSLNEAQNTLENYHFHYDKAQKLIIDLRNLQKDKELARDIHDENEIKEEIAAKEKELQESMRILPLELADYLRSSILEEEKAIEEEPISENKTSEEQTTFETQNSTTENFQLNVTEQEKEEQSQEANNNSEPSNSSENSSTNNTTIIEQTGIHTTLSNEALLAYEDLSQQIENLKNEQLTNNRLLEETVNRIQEIIKEQRERYEKEGPFDTDTLTRLDEYYMGLKISENEVFVELQRNETRLARKLKSLEKKQQEIANIDDISIAFGISYEESEELFKTLKNRKVITEIFEKKGLGNLIHKSSRTKAEKELLKQTLEEIRKEIITHRKTNKDINIKDTINILYGMDTKVRKGNSKGKELALPGINFEHLKNNTKQLPAVIRKPNTTEIVSNKPLEGPKDIPRAVEKDLALPDGRPEILGLPDKHGEKKLALPDKKAEILALPDKHGNVLALPDKHGNVLALPDKRGNVLALPDKHEQDSKQSEKKEQDSDKTDSKLLLPQPPKKEQQEENNKDKKVKPIIRRPSPIKKDTPQESEEKKLKRGLREIIGSLRQGLEIGKKDGQRYHHSNLKVSQNFKNELRSGNVLYNIVHIVPATIKAGVELLEKISAKIMLGTEAKNMMRTLEQRIDNLPSEDLETIYREYRGNRINQERYPQALNMVIEKKISEYILGKVTVLNENIEKNYTQVIYYQNLLTSIDDNLRKGKLSSEDKLKKLEQRKEILKKAATSIKYIRSAKIEADNLLSGGLHGLSEDMKASASKLNCVGMRFSKTYDMDTKLEDALMDCEKRENKAIYEENDEELLKSFIESEVLLSKNTVISNSIFGKRSTGKKYYSPLAEQLDYRNDPFIRDLFTTIAVTTAALNATTALKNQTNSSTGVSNANDEFLNKVHKAGEDITARRGAMYEGMKAQANQDVLTGAGSIERTTLDANGWSIGTDAYHAADHAGHEFYNSFYNDVQERIANVTRNYSGVGDQSQILQDLSQIATDSHATLVNVASKCLEILKPYAQNNPQFDLSAFQDTMEFLVNNPNAIANMNQAMVDVQNIGEELISLSESQLAMITNLPNNLGPSILSAASACALASNVANTMNGTKRKQYGNNVTDMISSYAYSQENNGSTKTI